MRGKKKSIGGEERKSYCSVKLNRKDGEVNEKKRETEKKEKYGTGDWDYKSKRE